MKKILGLLGTICLTTSSSAVAVACGNNNDDNDKEENDIKAMTPALGVDTLKIIESLQIEQADGKILKDYKDTPEIPESENSPAVEGFVGEKSIVEFDAVKVLFVETKELISKSDETKIEYNFSIQAKKDSKSAKIYLIKTDKTGLSAEGKGTIKNSAIYTYTVELPQPEVHLPTIDAVISETNLGELVDNEVSTILVAVKSKNAGLNESEVEVLDITDTSAKIAVKFGSKVYAYGSVNVEFSVAVVLPTIDSVISETNLGELVDNEVSTILAAVKSKNAGLNESEVEVLDITDTSAKIAVKFGSKVYAYGSVNVEFSVAVVLPTIDSVISETNLGELVDNEVSTILAAVKSKNAGLNESEVEVLDITDTSAKIAVKSGSTVYAQGSVKVEFSVAVVLPTIDSVISETNLGELVDNEVSTILAAVKSKNAGLNESEVEVLDITDTSAKIAVKSGSTVYAQGSVKVEFSVAVVLPTIDSVISETNLGELVDNEVSTILAAVKSKNAGLNESEVEVLDITDTSAKIAVKSGSTVYAQGSVKVEFSVAVVLPTIDSVISETNLGELVDDEVSTILAAVKSKNAGLNESEVEVLDITDTSAKIAVKSGSTVYAQGSVKVEFSVAVVLPTIDSVISETNLGELVDNEVSTILAAVKSKNAGLNESEVEVLDITDTSAKIAVKSGSTVYAQGSVNIIFTVQNI